VRVPTPPTDVLLTGAKGFVGRHVLEQGRAAGLRVVPLTGDARDPGNVAAQVHPSPPAAIVHLASALRRPGAPIWQRLVEDLAMLGALLTALQGHEGTLLVAVGSAAQYGASGSHDLAETAPTGPVTPYGAAKCILEKAALAAPLRSGVRVVWARPFNHVGTGQGLDAPVPSWARRVAVAEATGGGTVDAGELDVVRDLLDVRDVANAYLALARSNVTGIVNICSGKPVVMSQVMAWLIDAAHVPLRVIRDPSLLRHDDPVRVVGDPGRLLRETDWTPRIDVQESVRAVLDEQRAFVGPDALPNGIGSSRDRGRSIRG
jgi:GDP-4-dehydro-6-deoxy-D-mannose reductase